MLKWLLLSLSFTSLFTFPSSSKKEYTYTFDTAVEGMKYALYEDKECETPIQDENGDVCITFEKQSVNLSLPQEKVYAKQIKTVQGYYLDPTVYAVEEKNTFPCFPIHVTYTSDVVDTTYVLKDDKDTVLLEWNGEESGEIAYDFEIQHTYTIQEKQPTPYQHMQPVSFEIQSEPVKEPMKIACMHEAYGVLHVQAKDQEENAVEEVTYALYEEATCENQVKDIHENLCEALIRQDEELSWDLKAGIYYLKQIGISELYYRQNRVVEIDVKDSETMNLVVHEKRVIVDVILRNKETEEDIGGAVYCEQLQKEICSNTKVYLSRNTAYDFRDEMHPDGFYPCTSFQYQTSEFEKEEQIIVYFQPFTVSISLVNEDTSKDLSSGTYAILNENQQEVMRFSLDGSAFVTSSLHDGICYTLREIASEKGYLSLQEKQILIDSNGSSSLIAFTYAKTPYTNLTLQLLDGKQKVNGKYTLYTDAACQTICKDIYGNYVENVEKASIRNGTYYVLLNDVDSHYYLMDGCKKVVCDQGNQLFSMDMEHTGIHVEVKDSHGRKDDVVLELLDDSSNVLSTFLSQEVETIDSYLERNHAYAIRIKHIDGLYTYDKKPVSFTMPSHKEAMDFVLECEAYVNLKIQSDGLFALYEDPYCTYLCKDIYGNYTKKDTNKEWFLREGTYYLKQLQAPNGFYVDEMVQKIVVSSEASLIQRSVEMHPISFEIVCVSENGEKLNGAIYSILDQDGNEIGMINDDQHVFTSDVLYPGMTFRLHEINHPSGYVSHETDIVYTVPESYPEQIPCIQFRYAKISEAKAPVIKEVKEVIQEDSSSFPYAIVIGGIAGVFVIIGILIRRIQKSKQK